MHLFGHLRNGFLVQGGHHFELPDRNKAVEAMRVPACLIDLVTVKSIVLKYADTRGIVEKGLKALKDGSGQGRLLNVSVVVGVGVEDESAAQVEEHRVVVELVVSELYIAHQYEHEPKHHLQVRKQEDYEDEPLEVQLAVGPDTQSVANCQQDVSEERSYPVDRPRLLGTEELEGLHRSEFGLGTLPDEQVEVGSSADHHGVEDANEHHCAFLAKQPFQYSGQFYRFIIQETNTDPQGFDCEQDQRQLPQPSVDQSQGLDPNVVEQSALTAEIGLYLVAIFPFIVPSFSLYDSRDYTDQVEEKEGNQGDQGAEGRELPDGEQLPVLVKVVDDCDCDESLCNEGRCLGGISGLKGSHVPDDVTTHDSLVIIIQYQKSIAFQAQINHKRFSNIRKNMSQSQLTYTNTHMFQPTHLFYSWETVTYHMQSINTHHTDTDHYANQQTAVKQEPIDLFGEEEVNSEHMIKDIEMSLEDFDVSSQAPINGHQEIIAQKGQNEMPKMEAVQQCVNLLTKVAPEMFTPQAINQIYHIYFNKMTILASSQSQSVFLPLNQAIQKYQTSAISGVKVESRIQPELNNASMMDFSPVQAKAKSRPSRHSNSRPSEDSYMPDRQKQRQIRIVVKAFFNNSGFEGAKKELLRNNPDCQMNRSGYNSIIQDLINRSYKEAEILVGKTATYSQRNSSHFILMNFRKHFEPSIVLIFEKLLKSVCTSSQKPSFSEASQLISAIERIIRNVQEVKTKERTHHRKLLGKSIETEGKIRGNKFDLHRSWNSKFEEELLRMYQDGTQVSNIRDFLRNKYHREAQLFTTEALRSMLFKLLRLAVKSLTNEVFKSGRQDLPRLTKLSDQLIKNIINCKETFYIRKLLINLYECDQGHCPRPILVNAINAINDYSFNGGNFKKSEPISIIPQ